MARPTPRPKDQKKLDSLFMDVHRARTAAREAWKPGGNAESADQGIRRAWSAIHSHCERRNPSPMTDGADYPFRLFRAKNVGRFGTWAVTVTAHDRL